MDFISPLAGSDRMMNTRPMSGIQGWLRYLQSFLPDDRQIPGHDKSTMNKVFYEFQNWYNPTSCRRTVQDGNSQPPDLHPTEKYNYIRKLCLDVRIVWQTTCEEKNWGLIKENKI